MSDSTPPIANPLDSVVNQLRGICNDAELLKSSIDAGTVRRMLVHITNINHSVLTSTQDHVNAAKRLNDFAFSLLRMGRKSAPPNEELVSRVTLVADDLRAASDELTRSDSIPNWQAPTTAH